MWVTQTYLRSPDSDSAVHVYYLFEDYDQDQVDLTNAIQQELAGLGQRYGRAVTLYMPEPSAANAIQEELRRFEALWWSVHKRLPGLLILTCPLEDYDQHDPRSFFIPLWGDQGAIDTPRSIAEMIQRLTEITDKQLQWEYAHRKPDREIYENGDLFDAIEMKPGFWGFSVDLKKLLKRRHR